MAEILNNEPRGNYEERERLTLFEAVTDYLINLNTERAYLFTTLYDKNRTLDVRRNLFRFRYFFRQLYDFTSPLIFTDGNDELKDKLEDWFIKRSGNISPGDRNEIVKEGIDLSYEFQKKLKSANLMPILSNVLKPPFDLDVDGKEEEEE